MRAGAATAARASASRRSWRVSESRSGAPGAAFLSKLLVEIVSVAQAQAGKGLTQKRIFLFWLPLASSWLLMMCEVPFVSAAIARLPNAETMIAGFGIATSLCITIESPVIMLLATATALAANRQAYLMLRRFTQHLMALTTLVHLLVGFTPLYDVVVRGWMGIPVSVADAAQPGIQIMALWSAAIAWRRFKQGVMIRYGDTRLIGIGTVVRLTASAGTATSLAVSGRLTGVAVGGVALMAGVLSEMAYAQWASTATIRRQLGPQTEPVSGNELSYKTLATYHLPLAAVSLLTLLGQPLIGAALARAANPEASLAAWPVVFSLLGIFRSLPMALPEAVIALSRDGSSLAPLRRFCVVVGVGTSAALLVVAVTSIGQFYMTALIGVADNLAALALPGVLLGVAIPFIMSIQSYWRGVLMSRKSTGPVYVAMMVNLVTLAIVLAVGALANLPGVQLAVVALTSSLVTEGAILAWRVSKKLAV